MVILYGAVVFLQSKYAQHNDAILLVIIPASQAPDISSSKALRIAKEYDGESELTMEAACLLFTENKRFCTVIICIEGVVCLF